MRKSFIPPLVRLFENAIQEAPQPGPALWDKFAKDFNDFKKIVDDECKKDYGRDYKDVIDKRLGKGYTDKLLKKLYDKYYSPHEAHGDIGFVYDTVTSHPNSIQHYSIMRDGEPGDRYDNPEDSYDDPNGGDYFERKIHPHQGYFNEHGQVTPEGVKANNDPNYHWNTMDEL